jgi:hypothetical protein
VTRRRTAVVLASLLAGIGVVAPVVANATSAADFTKTVTVKRVDLVAGKSITVDERTVSVSVDQTKNLADRQGIQVTWSGAHPTGGIVADTNSAAANGEEYPVVLMQCRGVDSTSVPKSQQLSPETCWTQTPSERYGFDYSTPWPIWRLDRWAPLSERGQYVDVSKPRPTSCSSPAMAERWVAFIGADGKRYPGGAGGCAGSPPEMTALGSTLALPGNTTYGVTDAKGRGSALFNVRTAENNASLGCSQDVPCSLVVIPIMGVSCDVDAAQIPPAQRPTGTDLTDAASACQAKGVYQPGELQQPNKFPDKAVTGSMWWSASNWRNRISVPLSFAPSANVCDITSGGSSVDIYGSELMTQATTQWSPKFCLDPAKTAVHHVQTGEPQAASLLKVGSINAALVSDVPDGGWGKPVVNAPVGMTGFVIAYSIDNENGQPYGKLRLDARLLAKLMTESYPDLNIIKSDYPALSGNPLNLAQDPEFQALNPGVPTSVSTDAAATLLLLNSDSDVIHALTSYINADPEARAWLNGTPDPWGMVVNPNYKDIALPRTGWPLLDQFEPLSYYRPGVNDCLAAAPVPFLPLVANPLNRFGYVSLAMQFSIAQSQTVCYLPSPIPGDTAGAKLVPVGRQTGGHRFMLGLTTMPDAARYHLATAALQTYVAPSAAPNLATTAGRTFVRPDTAGLQAAAALLRPDAKTQTWDFPYDSIATDQGSADAYPGAMLVSASVPTSGLADTDAKAYAAWVDYASSTGQQPGASLGQLPAGYLPLTAANGLGDQAAYSACAADAIAAQQAAVPSVSGGCQTSGGGTPPPSGGNSPPPSGGNSPPPTQPTAALGTTVAFEAGTLGVVLPALLAAALLAALMVPITILRTRRRAR